MDKKNDYTDAGHSVEMIYKRQRDLVAKHPELKEALMTDPHCARWLECWSRTDMDIETGLAKLSVLLLQAKQETQQAFEQHLATNPNPVFKIESDHE